jgi:hypothetical protein
MMSSSLLIQWKPDIRGWFRGSIVQAPGSACRGKKRNEALEELGTERRRPAVKRGWPSRAWGYRYVCGT